jgi:hypothetical protein
LSERELARAEAAALPLATTTREASEATASVPREAASETAAAATHHAEEYLWVNAARHTASSAKHVGHVGEVVAAVVPGSLSG